MGRAYGQAQRKGTGMYRTIDALRTMHTDALTAARHARTTGGTPANPWHARKLDDAACARKGIAVLLTAQREHAAIRAAWSIMR